MYIPSIIMSVSRVDLSLQRCLDNRTCIEFGRHLECKCTREIEYNALKFEENVMRNVLQMKGYLKMVGDGAWNIARGGHRSRVHLLIAQMF